MQTNANGTLSTAHESRRLGEQWAATFSAIMTHVSKSSPSPPSPLLFAKTGSHEWPICDRSFARRRWAHAAKQQEATHFNRCNLVIENDCPPLALEEHLDAVHALLHIVLLLAESELPRAMQTVQFGVCAALCPLRASVIKASATVPAQNCDALSPVARCCLFVSSRPWRGARTSCAVR